MKFFFFSLIIINIFILILSEECEKNIGYNCDEINTEDYSVPQEWDDAAFQTPPRGDIFGRHKPTYQDMHYLVGYAQLKYSKKKNICTITFITRVNPILGEENINYYILYKFGETEINQNKMTFNSLEHSYPQGISLSSRIISLRTNEEISKLELDEIYFMWDNPEIKQPDEYEKGQRGAIVELFGWPYDDIKEECEFLSIAGYMGLKIFSPNEHVISRDIVEGNTLNPWYYGTQTVSYKLETRLGNKKQLKSMINKCRSLNLRIYAEVTINHMTLIGFDCNELHITPDCSKSGARAGTAGSPFWQYSYITWNNPYTNKKPQNEYPGVPFFPSDFHCCKAILDPDDPVELCYGQLFNLLDVNTEKEYPQQRIADFFTELISIGFSGIMITNIRHIPSYSLSKILVKLKENLGDELPDDFMIVLIIENIDINLVLCDDDSILNYNKVFSYNLKDEGFLKDEIDKIKFWFKGCLSEERYLEQYEPLCDDELALDVKRLTISLEYSDDINLADTGYNIYIKNQDIESHRNIYLQKMFGKPKYDWPIRFIYTSYSVIPGLSGVPDGKSSCSYCETESCRKYCTNFPYRKAYNPKSKGYDCGNKDNWIEGEYTRIHRDFLIVNAMRNWMFHGKGNITEEELYGKEMKKISKINCSEECLMCDEENKEKNMCLICDKSKGYFPLIIDNKNEKFFECIYFNFSLIYEKIYFNFTEEAFKPCYNSCKTCFGDGTLDSPNCIIEDNGNCELYNYLQYKCNLSIENITEKESFVNNIIKEIQNGYLNNLLEKIIHDKMDFIINGTQETYQISTLSNQIENIKISSINLSYCENILKQKYNLSENEEIIIFKIEHYIPGFKIPIIEYYLFTQNGKTQLDLSYCKDTKIIYNIPVNINENELYKYDMQSDYYNDICYPYTANNKTDITLPDRKREFNDNNMSLCQSDCTFLKYNSDTKNVQCECNIKNETFSEKDINIDNLLRKFTDIKSLFNYAVMKCAKLLFSKQGLLANIGSYVILLIIFINLMEYIMFFIEGKKKYFKEINDIINKVISVKTRSYTRKLTVKNVNNIFSRNNIMILNKKKNKKISMTEYDDNKSDNGSKNKIMPKIQAKNLDLKIKKEEKEIKEIKGNEEQNIIYENKNDSELNSLSFNKALKYDKRTYWEYYLSLLRNKQLIIFVCYTSNDYNSRLIKLCFLFSSFALSYTVNALFFNDSTMHRIYKDEGKDNISFRIPQIIYSTIISTFIKSLLTTFSLTEKNILEIKNQKTNKSIHDTSVKIFKIISRKIIIFFVVNFLFLIFFWYYLSCFCAVYTNTQILLLKDTVISFCVSLLYPFIINLIPGILRNIALNKGNKYLFIISRLIALI